MQRSNGESEREEKARGGRRSRGNEGRERGTNVAIVIDTLACKRCLLYVYQSTVVVAMFQVCAPVFEEPELPSSPIAVDRTDENSSYRIGERRVGQRANAGTERQPPLRLRRRRRDEEGGSRRRVVAFLASLGRRTATSRRPTRGFSRERTNELEINAR